MLQILILILTKSGKPEINKLKIKLSVSDGLKAELRCNRCIHIINTPDIGINKRAVGVD
jgi:hypothetical protein